MPLVICQIELDQPINHQFIADILVTDLHREVQRGVAIVVLHVPDERYIVIQSFNDTPRALFNDGDMEEGPALGIAQLRAVMAAVEQGVERVASVCDRGYMYWERPIVVYAKDGSAASSNLMIGPGFISPG